MRNLIFVLFALALGTFSRFFELIYYPLLTS